MMMEADVVVENSPPSAGSLLRKARESKGMGLDEVVGKLKLSRRQVEALEADNFSELPGLTFVRGFVRNYARVLDVDPAPILALLDAGPQTMAQLQVEALPAEPKAPQLVKLPHRSGYPRARRVPVRLIAGAIVAGLVVAGGALLVHQSGLEPELTLAPASPPAPVAASDAQKAPPAAVSAEAAASAPVEGVAPVPAAAESSVSANAVSEPAASPAPTESAAATATTSGTLPAQENSAQLRLAFEGDSWVDIRDADGKKIASKLYKPGAEDTLNGKPPFQLVIGNAAQVKLFYNGRPVDLAAHVKINVARLKLE